MPTALMAARARSRVPQCGVLNALRARWVGARAGASACAFPPGSPGLCLPSRSPPACPFLPRVSWPVPGLRGSPPPVLVLRLVPVRPGSPGLSLSLSSGSLPTCPLGLPQPVPVLRESPLLSLSSGGPPACPCLPGGPADGDAARLDRPRGQGERSGKAAETSWGQPMMA